MWLYLPSACLPVEAGSTWDSSVPESLAQSVAWNTKLMPPRSWLRVLKTVPWMTRLSGLTCPPSTASRGVESWISSLAASRARTSPAPGREPGSTESEADCGESSPASSRRSDPGLCSSKTCPLCSLPPARDLVAYAAGIVDGEGCLIIASTRSGDRTRYWPVLRVNMKDPRSLNVLARLFGGKPTPVNRTRPGDAAMLTWSIGGIALRCILSSMFPHLQVKRAQAEVILRMLSKEWPKAQNGRGIDWLPEVGAEWEAAKQEIAELQRMGQAMHPKAFAMLVGDAWMTPQRDLLGERWAPFSGTWPRWGSLRNGVVSEPPTWARPTDGSGSSFWPSPDAGTTGEKDAANRQGGPSLGQLTTTWPSPNATDFKSSSQPGQRRGQLSEAAEQEWGTPNSHPRTHSPRDVDHGKQLANQVGAFGGTPDVGAAKASGAAAYTTESGRHAGVTLTDQACRGLLVPVTPLDGPTTSHTSLRLNPRFVEALMGWPIGHSDCDSSETESSRSKPHSPGKCSCNG